MSSAPVNLTEALASFDDIYSPRIVGRVNDYDVKIAHAMGEHVWHVHDDTDEFFLVLDGQFDIAIREAERPRAHRRPAPGRRPSWCPVASSTSRRRPAARS